MNEEFFSKHFKLEKVSDGVFSAIAKAGSGSAANAGFIDLGDQTIIFDTFNTPQAAEDLKRAAERVTGSQIIRIVNSHYHGDHIRGNQVFKGKTIISSQLTYEKMRKIHPARIEKQKQGIKELEKYIGSLKEQVSKNKDDKIEKEIGFLSEIESSLPILELTLPNQTFKEEITFYGTKRSAKLFTLGGGHAYCDAMLFIPEEKVLFAGDLLFVKTHPSFFDESNPQRWVQILKTVNEMDFERAVPGHGPVGTKEDCKRLIGYLEEISELALTGNDLEEQPMPADCQGWLSPELYQQSIQKLKKLLAGSSIIG